MMIFDKSVFVDTLLNRRNVEKISGTTKNGLLLNVLNNIYLFYIENTKTYNG